MHVVLAVLPLSYRIQKTGDNRAPWKTRGNDNATQEQSALGRYSPVTDEGRVAIPLLVKTTMLAVLL